MSGRAGKQCRSRIRAPGARHGHRRGAAQRVHEIDFWGPTRAFQVFADLLVASRGRVVNVSSSASVTYSPWVAAYATSKAALNTLSETMRLELAPFCVSVVTILPGHIDSNLHVNDAARFDPPPTSRYASISKIIESWANGEVLPNDSLSAEKFAGLIVHDIVGSGKGGLVSRGPYAVLLRRIGQWASGWLAVSNFLVFSLPQPVNG
ncbi:hypothetical protein F5B21DRAFT_492420 [Xylaria acuta]|nr:hypothetical protein F5B21DRAFT_492420 [Xylaria acuta]